MNLKKGLFRLFLVSSVGVFIWAYSLGVDTASKTYWMQYDNTKLAIEELKNPVCQDAIKGNPDKYPDWESKIANKNGSEKFSDWLGKKPYPCSWLSYMYGGAKVAFDKGGKVGQIGEQHIRQAFEDTWGSYRFKRGAIEGLIGVAGFWALLALASIAFLILRWVYRGFKK